MTNRWTSDVLISEYPRRWPAHRAKVHRRHQRTNKAPTQVSVSDSRAAPTTAVASSSIRRLRASGVTPLNPSHTHALTLCDNHCTSTTSLQPVDGRRSHYSASVGLVTCRGKGQNGEFVRYRSSAGSAYGVRRDPRRSGDLIAHTPIPPFRVSERTQPLSRA
jgi:hypothetical protein